MANDVPNRQYPHEYHCGGETDPAVPPPVSILFGIFYGSGFPDDRNLNLARIFQFFFDFFNDFPGNSYRINIIYFFSLSSIEKQQAIMNRWAWGGFSTLLVFACSLAIVKGISLFGQNIEFSESGAKILFGSVVIFNLLFNINIPQIGFNIGIGLINPMFELFVLAAPQGLLQMIGFFLASTIAIVGFLTGMMTIQGS